MTEKLYYRDCYISEFWAEVLSCEEDKKGYKVVLDQTAFFAEGGGQYGDIGWIDGVNVFDTQEKDGVVYHYTKEPVEVGKTVKGRLDWETRFDRMQQHSGEHIISGLVCGRFGYNNVGFHLADGYCTMDFNGPISQAELKEIEEEANRIVFRNQEINILYPTADELLTMDYRSKIEIRGQVRIIEIPGVDMCACCAPHLSTTGEIGLIKLVQMDNYKGGERIYMLSGLRALRDYEMKEKNTKAISALLCAKDVEIIEAVEHQKKEISALKGEIMALKQKLLAMKAEGTSVEGEIVSVFDEDLSGQEPREMMNLLLDKGAKICAVFAGNDTDGYRYVIGSKTEDVRLLSKTLNTAFNGRGGGKPVMVQGSLKGTKEEIKKML
ncbi:MAG: alanine--tRNA ligase-related protein [Dorea sp.]|nr:alanine--tRNA ligase-related protein [Dorea sp.]